MIRLEYLRFAVANLTKMKLRTSLTVGGVTVAVGAFACLLGFGSGLQKNINDSFRRMDVLNTVTVLPVGSIRDFAHAQRGRPAASPIPLDDRAIEALACLPGVVSAFPEIRLPAQVSLGGPQHLRFVQALPASMVKKETFFITMGRTLGSNEAAEVVISRPMTKTLGLEDPRAALGKTLEVFTMSLGLGASGPGFERHRYPLTIVGIMDPPGFGSPMAADIILAAGFAATMKKLPVSNLWDAFAVAGDAKAYGAAQLRVSSPAALARVKEAVRKAGFQPVSLDDQLKEMRTAFLILDMVLVAIGLVALLIATLGIVNTLVMSVLERTAEIGLFKAVGADDGDIRTVFLVEAALIGLAGGLAGLALGWGTSAVINRIVNVFLARQGVPFVDYFHFAWWLVLSAPLFAVVVSVLAGLFPAARAARIDPVRALRHE